MTKSLPVRGPPPAAPPQESAMLIDTAEVEQDQEKQLMYEQPDESAEPTTADQAPLKRGKKQGQKQKLAGAGGKKSGEAGPKKDRIPIAARPKQKAEFKPRVFAQPFCDFLEENPTVFHAVNGVGKLLKKHGFKELSERDEWNLEKGGKYFVDRNGSSLIAFTVGEDYEAGNGVAMIAGHIDAVGLKLKPIPKVQSKAGYEQLGVAPYANGMNSWWDRDLGIAGRVIVKESDGKVKTKLVKINKPIARIPSLAVHFGEAARGPFNPETQMVPIIGLEGMVEGDNVNVKKQGKKNKKAANANSEESQAEKSPVEVGTVSEKQDATVSENDVSNNEKNDRGKAVMERIRRRNVENTSPSTLGNAESFTSTQPERLVKAVSKELKLDGDSKIINWELELYDIQPATVGGLEDEFIYGGRIDDKLCSWAAIQGLLATSHKSSAEESSTSSGIIKCVALFDDEEIGSLLRQGARGNFLPSTISRVVDAFTSSSTAHSSLLSQTYARSFLLSADVTHAVNPNFLPVYLPQHAPRLNVGVAVAADANGHMTTDALSTAFLQRVAQKAGSQLQVFQIRNDSRSGGTVGPMLSSAMGVRAIDAGIPQLSMHSIRATTGALDPGLGVKLYKGFFDYYEEVDAEFSET